MHVKTCRNISQVRNTSETKGGGQTSSKRGNGEERGLCIIKGGPN